MLLICHSHAFEKHVSTLLYYCGATIGQSVIRLDLTVCHDKVYFFLFVSSHFCIIWNCRNKVYFAIADSAFVDTVAVHYLMVWLFYVLLEPLQLSVTTRKILKSEMCGFCLTPTTCCYDNVFIMQRRLRNISRYISWRNGMT